MSKKYPENLPIHLSPLLEPSPTGIAKLLAAWDGLCTETQILLLSHIIENSKSGYKQLIDQKHKFLIRKCDLGKIYFKAFGSTNDYIRYLAAKELLSLDDKDLPEDRGVLEEWLNNDSNKLVRFCKFEVKQGEYVNDPKTFWELPHEARLAAVRFMEGGEVLVNFISFALDYLIKDSKISEFELFEIILNYVQNPYFKEFFFHRKESYFGSVEYDDGMQIEVLWELVPKLPENISYLLIENLPLSGGLYYFEEKILDEWSDKQLERFFYRKDVDFKEIRRKYFFETENTGLRFSAASFWFNLKYDEFAQILTKPKGERNLFELTCARDLNLCYYAAIFDFTEDPGIGQEAAEAFDRRLKRLRSVKENLREQILEYKIYRFAVRVVPWENFNFKEMKPVSIPSELSSLSNLVVKDNTWDTFVAFSQNWPRGGEKYLPHRQEIWVWDK